MRIFIITLFPEMFPGIFDHSMLFKAQELGLAQFNVVNLRDFGIGPRRTVDDMPYGGGDGMLLRPEPLFAAVESVKQQSPDARVLLMTPRGKQFVQADAQSYADAGGDLIMICGRYEGYDERIVALVDKQVSVGPYVLTGGEIPAMLIADSVVRLIPGVLGGETSAEIESFADGATVEAPQYTRPASFRDMDVPKVLLNGNHQLIAKWRAENAIPAHDD